MHNNRRGYTIAFTTVEKVCAKLLSYNFQSSECLKLINRLIDIEKKHINLVVNIGYKENI